MADSLRKISQGFDPDSYDLCSGGLNARMLQRQTSPQAHRVHYPVLASQFTEELRSSDHWYKHVRYPYLALEFLLAGEMEFITEERREIARPGTLYVIAPGSTVRFIRHGTKTVHKLALIIAGENVNAVSMTLRLGASRLLELPDPASVEEKMRRIGNVIESDPVNNSRLSYSLLLDLSLLISGTPEQDTPLERALFIMENRYQENISIPFIASRAGVSENTLRRIFQRQFRCSPLAYLNSIRLKNALEKLKNPKLSVKQAALLCGFSSAASFCTAFRKKYRLSPGEFRAQRLSGK